MLMFKKIILIKKDWFKLKNGVKYDMLKIQNRKGVSIMVGYVLLVVFAVIIGAITFAWLKTYVPAEALNCPDGVSVFVSEAAFNDSTLKLNLSLRNNGRFDIAGYFIHASNDSSQELPTMDLSPYLNESFSGKRFGNSVVFDQGGNLFKTGEQERNIFDIPSEIGGLYSIRIIPTRFQEVDNRQRFVSCSGAKVQQLVGEPIVCIPKTCSSLGYTECNPPSWSQSDGCGGILDCGSCLSPEQCDVSGECYDPSNCMPAPNPTLPGVCGSMVCGTATNGTCGSVSCGTCITGFECNATGQCVSTIGNGVCDPGEDCSEPACAGQQAQCQTNYICQGGSCVLDTSGVSSCQGYCVLLGNYSTGFCTNSVGNCQNGGGVYQSVGDQWCTGGAQADTCCCTPL